MRCSSFRVRATDVLIDKLLGKGWTSRRHLSCLWMLQFNHLAYLEPSPAVGLRRRPLEGRFLALPWLLPTNGVLLASSQNPQYWKRTIKILAIFLCLKAIVYGYKLICRFYCGTERPYFNWYQWYSWRDWNLSRRCCLDRTSYVSKSQSVAQGTPWGNEGCPKTKVKPASTIL